MTIETATQFAKKIVADEKLQAEIETAVKGVGDPMETARRAVAIGKKHGFEFTPEEELFVKTSMRQAAIERRLLDAQLTDEELEIVAGGVGQGPRAAQRQNRLGKPVGKGAPVQSTNNDVGDPAVYAFVQAAMAW